MKIINHKSRKKKKKKTFLQKRQLNQQVKNVCPRQSSQPLQGQLLILHSKTKEGDIISVRCKGAETRRKSQKSDTFFFFLVADGDLEGGVDRTAVGSVVVLGLQVGIGTRSVASMAVDTGAVLAGMGGLDAEAVLGELGVAAHVDARHVPEDSVAALGVFELEDVVLVGLSSQLDRHTTAVAVGLPLLRVRATARREGLHVSSTTGNGPRVDVVLHVVGDGDTTTAATALGRRSSGEGRSESGQSGEETELVEHHFEENEDVFFLLCRESGKFLLSWKREENDKTSKRETRFDLRKKKKQKI